MANDPRQFARSLISRERGMVFIDRGGADLRIALAYPNVYHLGMSNLGFQSMYKHFNLMPGVACERVFLPDAEEERTLIRQRKPLTSFECGRKISDFDIFAFSVSFENDYVNLLKLLDLSHIPFLAKDRSEVHPLVLIGGAVTFINPEPLADFADVIIIGEGEETSDRYLEQFRQDRGRKRTTHLREVMTIPGVYVPSFTSTYAEKEAAEHHQEAHNLLSPTPVEKQQRPDLSEHIAHSAIVTDQTEFSDIFLIEISRGCPRHCRFCAVSYIYPKFRTVSAEHILKIVGDCRSRYGVDNNPGFDRVGLVSSAICDYQETDALCEGLLDMGLKVSVSSLRIDLLTQGLLNALARSGQRTMTIAPEAGSYRLRKAIKKTMTDEQILDGAGRALDVGIQHLKIYAMVGLPTETEEDLAALVDLTHKLRKLMYDRQGPRPGRLSLSVNPFIPKPLTPFQWSRMEPLREIKRRMRFLERGIGKNAEIHVENYRSAYLEGILSRGGREMSDFLIAIHRFEGDWKRAVREIDLNVDAYLDERPDRTAVQPWDFIYYDGERNKLDRELNRALKLTDS